MMNRTEDATEDQETKAFLQEGFERYGHALVAIAEFRRQTKKKMMEVLNDYAPQLAELGLPIDDLVIEKLPNLDSATFSPTSGDIALANRKSAAVKTKYSIDWDTQAPADAQIRVGAFIWVEPRPRRDTIVAALEKRKDCLRRACLERDDDIGFHRVSLHCAGALFSTIEGPFRTLVNEWVELLTKAGIVQYLKVPEIVADGLSEDRG